MSAMPISRRGLLFGGAAVLGLAALRLGWSHPEDAVTAVLRKRLRHLQLDESGLRDFARDFAASGKMARDKLRLIAALAPLYQWLPSDDSTPAAVRHGEERLVTAFLLSSDFFLNAADERKPVRYLRLFDPWSNPGACQNPFARRGPEDAA